MARGEIPRIFSGTNEFRTHCICGAPVWVSYRWEYYTGDEGTRDRPQTDAYGAEVSEQECGCLIGSDFAADELATYLAAGDDV